MASERNPGLTDDELFVGITRPAMRWGVTYGALIANLIVTMEIFLLTKNLLALLIGIPLHALCALMCLRDAQFFELLVLWIRTSGARIGRSGSWRVSTCSPLIVDLPDGNGDRRKGEVYLAC